MLYEVITTLLLLIPLLFSCSGKEGMIEDRGRAFGVRSDRRVGMLRLELQEFSLAERLVDDADTRPEQHFAAELARKIAAQMPVRSEDNLLVLRNLLESYNFV